MGRPRPTSQGGARAGNGLVTFAYPVTAPGEPLLSGTAGNTVATLTWSPPASTGGTPVNRYRVFQTTFHSLTVTASTRTITVRGLTDGTT